MGSQPNKEYSHTLERLRIPAVMQVGPTQAARKSRRITPGSAQILFEKVVETGRFRAQAGACLKMVSGKGGQPMGIRTRLLCCIAGGAIVPIATTLATGAFGSETTTYTYDALGRLVATTRSGGPSSGVNMASCFDRAGNRLRYDTLTTTPAACPSPTPTPTPSP